MSSDDYIPPDVDPDIEAVYAASPFVTICGGNLTRALMLTFIAYQFDPDGPLADYVPHIFDLVEFDGHRWLPMGDSNWLEACGLPPDIARDNLQALEDARLIEVQTRKHKRIPRRHIRILWDALDEQLRAAGYGTQ